MDVHALDRASVEDVKRRLSHDQLIPRREVHKLANAEVFVTGSAPVSDDVMMLAGELPRTHCYYGDGAGFPARFDLMAILELCRQACFVMAHRHYGVRVGPQFILRTLEARLDPAVVFERELDPLRVFVQCSANDRFERAGTLTGVSWDFEIESAAGGHVATAAAAMSWMARERWSALRAGMRQQARLPADEISYRRPEPSAADPVSVGRESTTNVVLTNLVRDGRNVHGELVVDILHPGLFDHYVDHLSGMLEAEACRQLALWAVSGEPATAAEAALTGLSLTFLAVGELDVRTVCNGSLGPSGSTDELRVDVQLAQGDHLLCDGRADICFPPSLEASSRRAASPARPQLGLVPSDREP